MTLLQTIIIAIVEGLTEFLPVSSTGHMIITQKILGVPAGDPFVHAFTFIIQFGAILSVVVLYWKRFFHLDHTPVPNLEPRKGCYDGLSTMQKVGKWFSRIWKIQYHRLHFYWLLVIGVLPAVVVGFSAKKSGLHDCLLDSVFVVAVSLVVWGVFMLFCDRIFNKGSEEHKMTEKRAFIIGLFQCISLIPGTSRSMATIVGGMQQKLTRKNAAEFSFFLAVPTMAGATLLDLIDMFKGDTTWATSHNIFLLIVGCVVAFIVAILAMKWFVAFLTKYGFKAFGWYRIVIGGVILAMLLSGQSLQMVG